MSSNEDNGFDHSTQMGIDATSSVLLLEYLSRTGENTVAKLRVLLEQVVGNLNGEPVELPRNVNENLSKIANDSRAIIAAITEFIVSVHSPGFMRHLLDDGQDDEEDAQFLLDESDDVAQKAAASDGGVVPLLVITFDEATRTYSLTDNPDVTDADRLMFDSLSGSGNGQGVVPSEVAVSV